MPTFVALLRGINVGKAKRVPMAGLRALLSRLGYSRVATLLNSGNAVFDAPAGTPATHAKRIAAAISIQLKVEVPVIVKAAGDLADILEENPIMVSADEHSRLLVAFVQDSKALPSLAAIASLVRPPERFAIGKHAAYLAISPVLLGSGERLFEGVDHPALRYARVQHEATARATQLILSRQ